jgi:hypothetical protein
MDTKDKSVEEIEKQILDEFDQEMHELKMQGKLCKFETAMDHAKEKFEKALKARAERDIKKEMEDESKKKLPEMQETSKNSKLR